MMVLVVIVYTPFPSDSAGLETQNWISDIRYYSATGHHHMLRIKKWSEVIPEQKKFCVETYQLHTSPKFSFQTTAGPQFQSNFCSSILSNSGTSLLGPDYRIPK